MTSRRGSALSFTCLPALALALALAPRTACTAFCTAAWSHHVVCNTPPAELPSAPLLTHSHLSAYVGRSPWTAPWLYSLLSLV